MILQRRKVRIANNKLLVAWNIETQEKTGRSIGRLGSVRGRREDDGGLVESRIGPILVGDGRD